MQEIEPIYEVTSPLGRQRLDELQFATPLAGLEGKKIAFVWDMMFEGDKCFAAIADELAQRYDGMEFVGHEEFGDIHGLDEKGVLDALPGRLREHEIDGVVVGVGA